MNVFEHHMVFCDGACSGNPGRGGWGAVVVTAPPTAQVTELGAGALETTNNRMELTAAIEGLRHLSTTAGAVVVLTDSTYVIKGITQWVWGWRRRGWKTSDDKDVANRDLWEELVQVTAARREGSKVTWRYVRGHSGIPGNERVDAIAVAFTKGQRPALYRGPLLRYGIPIHDLPAEESLPERREVKPKAAAYSYLSVVDGVPQRHRTWAECERRVKGRSGARFKKATSAADEAAILKSWGVTVKD